LFIPKGGKMTFRIGGGNGPSTYVALCAEDGKELETARGINQQLMQKASWDLSKHVGKKTFIKIVDQSTGGWGHVTADNFQFDGKLLKQYFKSPVQ
jgi:arylsulfatase A